MHRASLAFAALAFVAGLHVGERSGPRLIGHGCLGANGPLYADAESSFPQCLTIERN